MPVSQRRLLRKIKAFTHWCAPVDCQTWLNPDDQILVTFEFTATVFIKLPAFQMGQDPT
jgi:hypothetical protein